MTNGNVMFVKTTDDHTAAELQQQGLKLFSKQSGVYVFVIDSKNTVKYTLNKQCYLSNKLVF